MVRRMGGWLHGGLLLAVLQLSILPQVRPYPVETDDRDGYMRGVCRWRESWNQGTGGLQMRANTGEQLREINEALKQDQRNICTK